MTSDLWQALVQTTGGVNAVLLGAILLSVKEIHESRKVTAGVATLCSMVAGCSRRPVVY